MEFPLSGTVLLVNPDNGARALDRARLERLGLAVIEATDGNMAEIMLDAHAGTIDVLFSDVQLAGNLDGIRLARHTRARYPDINVLLSSTDDAHEKTWESPDALAGVVVLIAPYLVSAIEAVLHRMLGDSR